VIDDERDCVGMLAQLVEHEVERVGR